MRLLYLNHNIAGRGTYFRCLHFARQVVKAGHAVTLITASGDVHTHWREHEIDGIRVLETPRLRPPSTHDGGYAPLDILERVAHVQAERYDIMHAFDHRPNVLLPAWLARFHGNPRIIADWADWWTRGGITTDRRAWMGIDRIEAWIEEGQKRNADAVTVTSRLLYERALDVGVQQERCLLLPSGADVDAIPVLERDVCRAQLGLPDEWKIALMAGFSLWDLDYLLEAMQHVVAVVPNARLLFVGHEKDGSVRELLQRCQMEEYTILPGALPYSQLPLYLCAADVCVLPMRDILANRARGPIKFGDYIAAGRPVVTQRVGDSAALVQQHGLGLVADCTAQALGEAIIELLQDPARCREMGERARSFAERECSWAKRAEPLLMLYERLV